MILVLQFRFRGSIMTAFAVLWALALFVAACGTVATPSATPERAPAPSLTVIPSPSPAALPTPPQGAATLPPLNSADWTTYHRDNVRSGYVPNLPNPQHLTVAWNTPLDGAVYAEPLVVDGHVLVATEADSVYSLDALTGKIEWQTKVGDPVPRSALPCGNINPLGITGTPVYDPASGLVFAVAEVTGPAHLLVGVDALTGQVKLRRSVDPDGMEPRAHQQRAALLLWQGMVYIAYGGLFGDCGNYHGWVVASRTDGSGALISYQVPTGREGGIWAPPGPAVDASGHIYVSVGNGSETAGNWDHSDSVLRLSAGLKIEDGFAPEQWSQDNAADADLGSLGPVLLSNGLIFIAGKSGTGYLLRANALGGVGGQVLAKPVCRAFGGAAVSGSTIFVPCNEGLQQVQVEGGATFTIGWQAKQVPGSPVIGGNTVYTLDRNGNLFALDIDTGRVRAQLNIGATSRFATPTLFQERIFVGTMTGIAAVTGS